MECCGQHVLDLVEVQSQGGGPGLLGEAPGGRGLAGEPSWGIQGHCMPLVALGLLGDALVLHRNVRSAFKQFLVAYMLACTGC